MSENFQRKAQPDCMRFIIGFLRSLKNTNGHQTSTIEQLIRVLVEEASYAKPTATDTIYNAIHDGLLVPVVSSPHGGSARGRLHENRAVRLAELNEVKVSDHDFYCFECHLPGMLELCTQCPRSFHRLCYRKDAERPNYTVPSAKLQKNRLPAFSTDESNSDDDECFGQDSTIPDYESDIRATSSLQALDQLSSAAATPQHLEEHTVDSTSSSLPVHTTGAFCDEDKTSLLLQDYSIGNDSDTKTKLEVVCLGEVRPPTRRRRQAGTASVSNVSYKSEISPSDDEFDIEKELCTCCRLLKSAALRNPPNFESDELCHLVNYTFSRNRSWVATDAACYLDTLKLSAKECDIFKKLLFKIPPFSMETIATKLQQNRYRYLMEFLVDILDIQHNVGVLFGTYSTELESTKWLVRDIAHDLSEIRRCPDCFRYSHEKRSSIWFAKPCVQRHELVFAKHSRFPYWPAKVIRVLPNNKYDVRFFGGTHSRALIDVKNIKPIDSDSRTLKLGNSQAMKKAMEELRYHQILSTYPPSKFSFHANKEETENILRTVLGRGIGTTNKKRGRKRKVALTTLATNFEQLEENSGNSIIELSYGDDRPRFPLIQQRRKSCAAVTPSKHNTRSAGNKTPKTPDIKKIQEDLNQALKIAEVSMQKNKKLTEQIQKLKENSKKYEIEKKILKRKQWCYWCLNEAIYLCCFKAAYCSEICQARHWKDGHSKVCKNQEDQMQQSDATSTT